MPDNNEGAVLEQPIIENKNSVNEQNSSDLVKDLNINVLDSKPKEIPVQKKEDPNQAPNNQAADKNNQSQQDNQQESTSNNGTTQSPEDEFFDVTPEDLGSFLNDETGGFIKNVSQLHQIIDENQKLRDRVKEIETNPIGAFKDPKQAAIAKFLMDYKGGDYHSGIQTYARLESLDIPNLKAEDALREAYVMEKAQAGVSRTDAEEMFKVEFERRYEGYGEAAEKFINADAFKARKEVEAARKSFTVEQAKNDDGQSLQQEQKFKEERARFEQNAEKALEGFKSIILSALTDNADDDFNFEIENIDKISDGMFNYQQWFSNRYTAGQEFNTERMKQDLSILENFEQIAKN